MLAGTGAEPSQAGVIPIDNSACGRPGHAPTGYGLLQKV